MILRPQDYLVRLRPRQNTLYVAQGSTVLATERNGFIRGGEDHGLIVHQTRLLSLYRYMINGEEPRPVALSNVEQQSWLGYYIALPPGVREERDYGSGQMEVISQQTIELRLSRYVADGLHEDVDITNFAQQRTAFTLTLEVDADFADIDETKWGREQQGELLHEWRETEESSELHFDYRVEHAFSNQEGAGIKSMHRGLLLRIERATSSPHYKGNQISFEVALEPGARWHACLNLVPFIDGQWLETLYGCRSFAGTHNEYDRRRKIFLTEATQFLTPQSATLTPVVVGALEQARRDLISLRLYDLDHNERAWTTAAGLPVYLALFGRDSLTAAWQAALLGPEMMKGSLPGLASWQGQEVNDWRDEQPGKMLTKRTTGH